MKLPSWLTSVRYRLSGSAYSAMEIPPDWNYEQYLRVYGQVGWLFGAVSLIANSVAEVPWRLYRLGAGGKKEELDNHPLLDLWAYMNPFQTRYQFTELLQMYLSLVGEAFIVLNYNRLGQPAEAWLAPPQYMVIVPSRDKYISHYEYQREGNVLRLEIPEVIHIMSPNPQNPYRGIAPAHAISTDLDTERFSARYQQRVFYNDGMPGLMIEYPDVPPKEERDKIRAEWNEIHRGWRNARKTGFLWGGAKASTLAISNKDMEYYNLRHVNRDVILGAYHIPGSLMGIAEIGSRARAEADEYIYAKYTVRPALTRIREALNEQLVPQFGPDLHFEFDDPVPASRVEQVDEAAKLVPIGVITREEARRKLGYDDKPASGETLLAPLTLLPETVKSWKGGDGSGNFGHDGRPGEVGGSGAGGSVGSTRSERAKTNYKASTAAVQRQAESNEPRLTAAIGGQQQGDNEAFDVRKGNHAIEVKTIVRGSNDKITMHPESLKRKLDTAKQQGLTTHTVVFDDRVGKIYYKQGVGSFRLAGMTEVSSVAKLGEYIS